LTQTVWVTGAAGFTGRFMIETLRAHPDELRIVGLDVTVPDEHSADEYFALDLCEPEALKRPIQDAPPDVVIHLAGLMPPWSEAEMRRVNVDGSLALANALLSAGMSAVRIISAGSAAEYSNLGTGPITEDTDLGNGGPYGLTKIEQSTRLLQLAANSGLSVIIARSFNLLGPGLSRNLVAGALCEQFMTNGRKGYIRPKGPIDSVRDFIDVRDVTRAYWLLAKKGVAAEAYNVCTGVGTEISRVINILSKEFDMTVRIEPDFDPAVVQSNTSIGDNSKLLALGWQPRISLEESLHCMVRAVRGEV